MRELRAFVVHGGDSGEEAGVVFASSEIRARARGRHALTDVSDPIAEEWSTVTVVPEGAQDGDLADTDYLRAHGWDSEDWDSCTSCGLSDPSYGENPKWKVCSDCECCGECGHHIDCKEY